MVWLIISTLITGFFLGRAYEFRKHRVKLFIPKAFTVTREELDEMYERKGLKTDEQIAEYWRNITRVT